jgi:8-oxo-dGTP pyrophosphatase MutT (NUDIX family)
VRAVRPELFEDITFSTRRVLGDTLARVKEAGLQVHLLSSSYDVDEPSDLRRLSHDLARTSPYRPDRPRRTAELVARLSPAVVDPPATDQPWTTLSRRDVYRNPWLRIDERVVDIGDGQVTLYGVVDPGPCVGVLPQREDGQVLLVKQYRYVAERYTWEIPTGGCRSDETPMAAAQRELEEESGYRAERLEPLTVFHTSKSVMDEVAHLFVARRVQAAGHDGRRDVTEQIEVAFFPFEELMRMIDSGDIVDSMTIIAALAWARRQA